MLWLLIIMGSLVTTSPSADSQCAADMRLARLERHLIALDREELPGQFRLFIAEAWPAIEGARPYHGNWHIDAIADHLQAVSDGNIRRLIINMPPRHMKSTLVGKMWPAWDWIKNPQRQILCASYAQGLSERDALHSRRLIQSRWYQARFGDRFKLTSDQNAKRRYDNNVGGYRLATSVTGSLTGEGGDVILVDDPHNVVERDSKARVEEVLDWWDSSMSTRLNDAKTGVFVIVMQRVRENDLCGHILARETGWDHLVLPARYEVEHPFHVVSTLGWTDPRKTEGELLHPERFGEAEIAEIEQKMRTIEAAGQLQQRPAPADGALFLKQWFRYARMSPDRQSYILTDPASGVTHTVPIAGRLRRVCTADTATTTKKTGDHTAVGEADLIRIPGSEDVHAVLHTIWHERAEIPQIRAYIRQSHAREPFDLIGIEDTQGGRGVIQDLRGDGFPVRALKPQGDKKARSNTVRTEMDCGRIWFLADDPRIDVGKLEDELLRFPVSDADDQVDMLSYLGMLVAEAQRPQQVIREFSQLPPSQGGQIVDDLDPDWGKWPAAIYLHQQGPHTGVLLTTVTPDGVLAVLDERNLINERIETVASEVRQMLDQHNCKAARVRHRIHPDAAARRKGQPLSLADEYRRLGLPVVGWFAASEGGEQRLIDKVRSKMVDGDLIIHRRCRDLVQHLLDWRYRTDQVSGDLPMHQRYRGYVHLMWPLMGFVSDRPQFDQTLPKPMNRARL